MTDRDLLQAAFRYALSLTKNREDAEDLAQQAWLKFLKRKGLLQSKSLFFKIIRNLFIDDYRRSKLIIFEPLTDSQTVTSDVSWTDNVNNAELESALSKIRQEEREAIFLNIVEGYSAKQIAKITGRSRNTVLSLIYRGKEKLARILSGKTNTEKNFAQIRR